MHQVILLLGTNQGNRLKNLTVACRSICDCIGKLKKSSSIYETEPWGFQTENTFYNQVIVISSEFSPNEVLDKILAIEIQMGRKRTNAKGYSSRIIDIDILFYDSLFLSQPNLSIPHPKIQERRFVLVPLNEILSDFIHPFLDQEIKMLLKKCSDELKVKKVYAS